MSEAQERADFPPRPPNDKRDLPAIAEEVDASQIRHFVTQIKSAEHQVGEHILVALQDPGTVAVLTAVLVGPDGTQRIVSAALNPDLLQQVQEIMQVAQETRDEEVPCVGFHCLLRQRSAPEDEADEDEVET